MERERSKNGRQRIKRHPPLEAGEYEGEDFITDYAAAEKQKLTNKKTFPEAKKGKDLSWEREQMLKRNVGTTITEPYQIDTHCPEETLA